MSIHGTIIPAIQHVRGVLETVLAPFKWSVLTAENPFQKWNILAATRKTGYCVVSWKSDSTVDQATRALVIRAKIAITICGRIDLDNPATGKLAVANDPNAPALFEIHDRIKGAMLATSLPEAGKAEVGAEIPLYGGSAQLTTPDGFPLDAIEQTWEVELVEAFSPEHTE